MEPKQKPGKSKQDYCTPRNFIADVEGRFGPLAVDLAARADNTKAPEFITPERDSLIAPWDSWSKVNAWLNPPFGNIDPWAAKCLKMAPLFREWGGRILLLTPASVGSNWYRDHVHDKARVIFLNGRLTFEGAEDAYPKDCMLTVFGAGGVPGFEIWTKTGGWK